MNPLYRTLIEKVGHENGFENSVPDIEGRVLLSSALHQAQATITQQANCWLLQVYSSISEQLLHELIRSFPDIPRMNHQFCLLSLNELGIFLRRTARLAQALPTQAINDYKIKIEREFARFSIDSIKGTEIETMVRQRIGQTIYRNAMLEYWGGACAVTGISIFEVLRASHAKPWKNCETDSERLDVFNGFLLNANLDALFDRFLISFDDSGKIIISSCLNKTQCDLLGLHSNMKLRWIAEGHLAYLRYHRLIMSCSVSKK